MYIYMDMSDHTEIQNTEFTLVKRKRREKREGEKKTSPEIITDN